MNKKTTLIALLIILISVTGISAYLLKGSIGQERVSKPVLPEATRETTVQPTPTIPSQPEIEISDWKTYRNEEYGFELKYPSDWRVEVDKYRDFRLYDPKSLTSLKSGKGLNPDRLTLDEWFKKTTVVQGRPTIDAGAKPTIINGIKFYRLDFDFLEFGSSPTLVFKLFTANAKNQILIIYGSAKTSNDVFILERILSTFHFDEQ